MRSILIFGLGLALGVLLSSFSSGSVTSPTALTGLRTAPCPPELSFARQDGNFDKREGNSPPAVTELASATRTVPQPEQIKTARHDSQKYRKRVLDLTKEQIELFSKEHPLSDSQKEELERFNSNWYSQADARANYKNGDKSKQFYDSVIERVSGKISEGNIGKLKTLFASHMELYSN